MERAWCPWFERSLPECIGLLRLPLTPAQLQEPEAKAMRTAQPRHEPW
jgi:hypothetical protein